MSHAMTWYQLTDTGMINLSMPASNDVSVSEPCISTTAISLADETYSIAPNLRALAYGDGFFSTIGVYQGALLWQSYHQARVNNHCRSLNLTLSPEQDHRLWLQLQQLATSLEHGIIKIILSRPIQKLRGYAYSTNPSDNEPIIWVGAIKTEPLATDIAKFITDDLDENHLQSGQVVLQQAPIIVKCLQSQLASLPPSLAGLKSLNRLDGVMIAGELQCHKQNHPELAEGLVADLEGNWVEGVMSNLFYRLKPTADAIKNQKNSKTWYTPPIVQSGVRGVMRQVIIDKLASLGSPAIERHLRNEDLAHIESMFFCNAVRGVMPVTQLLVDDELLGLSTTIYSKDG